jgi:hypothetical protein
VQNGCLESGVNVDGVQFDATQNGSVTDMTINVGGSTVTTINGATVSTSNISTSGSCTL